MNSTLDDVSPAEANRTRLVLRVITLTGLVVFLGAALIGAFDQPAQLVTSDGAVTVDYQGSIRPGNDLDVLVSLEGSDCGALTLGLGRDYAELITGLDIQPEPDAQTTRANGELTWEYTGEETPAWVRISGQAADGWSPPVTDTLRVHCDGAWYMLELRTRRVP